MADGFAIRPMQPSDEPFVFRAWLEGYWEHFPGRIIVTRDEYMRRYHAVIERILADVRTRTVVAHVEGEPDLLLGFACGRPYPKREPEDMGAIAVFPACLHWAYVKQAFRGRGIAQAMAAEASGGLAVSHWTKWIQEQGWSYAPSMLQEYRA